MTSETDTALDFLRAGEALVAERGLGYALPDISMNDLLERVSGDLSRRAFTHIWSRRSDYDCALYRHLARGVRDRAAERLERSSGAAVERSTEIAPLEETLRTALEHAVVTMRASNDFHLFNALWSYADNDNEIRQLLDETSAISEKKFAEQLKLMMAIYRRRMKPGINVQMLASALLAFAEGSVMRRPLATETPEYVLAAHSDAVTAIALSMTEES